jgi:hypothetical protein
MWLSERAVACEVCHTRLDEWEEVDENGKVKFLNPYLPHVYVCPGCKATGEAYEAVSKSAGKNHSTHGAKVRLITPEQKKAMIQNDALARIKAKELGGLAGGDVP